jgi:hypothetical protein
MIGCVVFVHAVAAKCNLLGFLKRDHRRSAAGGDEVTSTNCRSWSSRGIDLLDEWVLHRFPELSYVIAVTFYQGLVNAAFNIFYHENGPVFVIGTVCSLLTVAPVQNSTATTTGDHPAVSTRRSSYFNNRRVQTLAIQQ